MGINTAYRAGKLLSLTVGQVEHLEASERLEVYQNKTKRLRAVTMNRPCVAGIDGRLAKHPNAPSPTPTKGQSCVVRETSAKLGNTMQLYIPE